MSASSTSPQKYPYRPLVEPDSIRLLLIQPGKTEEIHCSLIHTTFYACRLELFDHYTALSYVWGDLKNPKLIWVDGIAVSVTSNLHAALCDLRDESRVFRLWVDALCINQSDLVEKGIQVSMMGKVYAAADRTVIHLGRPDNASDSVLRNLEHYSRQLLVQDEDSTQVESLHEQAMNSILSMPWFRRVWILQELVLSKEPLVQYGGHRVSWDEFCRFWDLVKKHSLSRTYQLATEMRDLRDRFHKNKGEIRMFDILLSRRGLGVADPRDMLYAHKGLASDAESLDVDYSKSCAQLYAAVSFHGMIQHSSHRILFYAQDGPAFSRLPGLPSWCPDWSQAPSTPKLSRRYPNRDPVYVAPRLSKDSPENQNARRAFLESNALIQCQESSVLTCRGIEVAVVTHLSHPLSSDSIERTNQEYFSSRLMSLKKLWVEEGYRSSRFEAAHLGDYSANFLDAFEAAGYIIDSFNPSIKQHIKSLRDLFTDIYNAWQSSVGDEHILPSLTSLFIWSTNESEVSDMIDGTIRNHGFLSDERIFMFGCWIFLDEDEVIRSERYNFDPKYEVRPGLPIYLQHQSTVDLLVQYFLPGFDKSLIDGRTLAQTTLLTNSLFFCSAMTAVGDHIFNLIPMRNSDPLRYFVFRDRFHEESWIRDTREEINRRFRYIGDGQTADDIAVMTCSFVGEAYGMINMYRDELWFEPRQWKGLSNKSGTNHVFDSLYCPVDYRSGDGFVRETKILAIF